MYSVYQRSEGKFTLVYSYAKYKRAIESYKNRARKLTNLQTEGLIMIDSENIIIHNVGHNKLKIQFIKEILGETDKSYGIRMKKHFYTNLK